MGGGNYWWKKLFRAKICVPAPLGPTSVLTQNKGPDTEPHFSNSPPLLRRASMSPPPPPRRAIFRLPDCLPSAAPIGLSPLLILTLCGPERVLVVSTEPPHDLSCMTTPRVGCPGDGLLPMPLTRGIQMHTPSPCGGLPTGGAGGLEPNSSKVCVPKTAQTNISVCKTHCFPQLNPGPEGGGGLACRLWSGAVGADWPIATYCPSLGPFPSISGGAHRPLTALCPPSPSLARPSLSTSPSFPLVGCANTAPGLSLFHCSMSGPHGGGVGVLAPPPPPCDIPSRCCSFTGPWAVTRSSLRMLRRVAAFCRQLRPVLLLVSFPRLWSPVVGVPGLC